VVAGPRGEPGDNPLQVALMWARSDFHQLPDVLTIAVVRRVRTYMDTNVQPVINKYWSDDALPLELLPSFKEALGRNQSCLKQLVPANTSTA
jgi:hypothetical protein